MKIIMRIFFLHQKYISLSSETVVCGVEKKFMYKDNVSILTNFMKQIERSCQYLRQSTDLNDTRPIPEFL
mgnify:CR=1 FL=1